MSAFTSKDSDIYMNNSEMLSLDEGGPTDVAKGTIDIGLIPHINDGTFTDEDIEFISSHLYEKSIEECRRIISEAINLHHDDTSLSDYTLSTWNKLLEGPTPCQTVEEWETNMQFEAFLIHDWSPYEAVRAVTRPICDEEFENYENIRVYLISIIWSCSGSVLATFFNLRFPAISIGSVAMQILIAYTGKMFRFIPDFSFPVGFGRRVHFGGGKWNFKEQMLATCGMGVGNTVPYSMNVVISMSNSEFYGFKAAQGNAGFIILLTLATNLVGFGLAGMYRIFLIYPVRLIWYTCLPTIRLSRILCNDDEQRENINGWTLLGWEFFWLFSLIQFCWYWVTDFLFTFLGYFDWVAWMSHKNNDMLAMSGVIGGLGISPLPTLDPSICVPTPMIIPWFSTVCTELGQIFSGLVVIGVWYMNNSWTSYIPINSNQLYDRFGKVFNVTKVLDPHKNLDIQKFKEYSLPFWSAGNLVSYGSYFALYPAMIVYSILNYTEILWFSLKIFYKTIIDPKRALNSFNDRFTRAQRKYKEVPEWWYLSFLCICIGISIATVEHYKFTNTPVWTIFFGIGLSAIFMIPCGVLYATTGNQVAINVLYELLIGLIVEGNGNALMVSKAFATNFIVEADAFITSLKQAHYIGLAPRSLFRIQILNCICNSLVQSGLMIWQSTPGSIPDMCTEKAAYTTKFTCQNIRTFFNAAVQWGTIGPRRVMRDLYPILPYSFLIGALYPLPFWIVRRVLRPMARKNGWGVAKPGASAFSNNRAILYFKRFEWLSSFNEILFVVGATQWAPSNFTYYLPNLYWGGIFQWYMPKYKPRWWRKYNNLLYAAILVGTSYSALVMFFATSYKHIVSVDWWGTKKAISLSSGPKFKPPAKGWFGPEKW